LATMVARYGLHFSEIGIAVTPTDRMAKPAALPLP